MARRPNQPEGLKKMTAGFNIYERGDGPNSYDCDSARGALKYVPREPIYRVMQFGGESTKTGGISAPARADLTNGRCLNPNSMRSTRELPETQLPGSMNATPGGSLMPKRSQND